MDFIKLVLVLSALLVMCIQDSTYASDYNYDVSGYGSSGEHVYGEIDANNGSKDVEGTLTLENGDQVQFEGEWVGNGQIEGTDENGETYEIEVE